MYEEKIIKVHPFGDVKVLVCMHCGAMVWEAYMRQHSDLHGDGK